MTDRLLTTKEAAEFLRMAEHTLRARRRRGLPPRAFPINRSEVPGMKQRGYAWRLEDLQEYVNQSLAQQSVKRIPPPIGTKLKRLPITDAQWALAKPHVPPTGRREQDRAFIDTLLLASRAGSLSTVCKATGQDTHTVRERAKDWFQNGTLERVMIAMSSDPEFAERYSLTISVRLRVCAELNIYRADGVEIDSEVLSGSRRKEVRSSTLPWKKMFIGYKAPKVLIED